MQSELVSVMMPAYNAQAYIGQAIESVLAQDYRNWELIIVDDGSTDGTAGIMAQYSDPRIRCVHQANAGEAAARNRALQEMQGEFLAFLDADDFFLPEHLQTTVRYLQAHPAYGGVYTDGYYCNEQSVPLQTLASRRIGPFEGRVFDAVVRASCLFGPPVCVVLRTAPIIQQQLAFDPTITIGPDWDFLIRYTDIADFGYLEQQSCLYRLHQSNITRQINLQKRALDLARCRSKAVQMPSFQHCSVETRTAVFYDLLIKLLHGLPEQQVAISHWPAFKALPIREQARLLRLMASKALLTGESPAFIAEWLQRSRALNPTDKRGALVATLYALNPSLCRLVLRLKGFNQPDPQLALPFADMQLSI
ncbi:MAG: glycosyltransferase family 2 protein [Caldilineaceae bacterium]|nr:glycosyltransferase family 2 protein [Caldilineaceae bacterium]